MIPIGDPKIVVDGDNCFCETEVYVGNSKGNSDFVVHTVERRLVMTKEVFQQCYKAWIVGDQE